MSIKSQQNNMRCLADLLGQNLGYIGGPKECRPNGAKHTFLHVGKVFLRALAKDLGLHDVKVISNAGGIAISGECCMCGMWQTNGLFLCIQQFHSDQQEVILYRTIRSIHDHKGGYNNYIRLDELRELSYEQLLGRLSFLDKGERNYERAA